MTGSVSSGKERIESWDDPIHASDDILQRYNQRFPWHRDILPRYRDGRLRLHLHIALEHGIFANCIEVFAPEIHGSRSKSVVRGGGELDTHTLNLAHGRQKQTMLVLIYEHGE